MNIQQKSKIIYNNCKDFKPFYADNDIEIVDTTEAYHIQDEFIRLKEVEGYGSIGGWKIALTNPEMQKLVGVNRPVEGAILKPLILKERGIREYLKNFILIPHFFKNILFPLLPVSVTEKKFFSF